MDDEEIRKRFHDHANAHHLLQARVLIAEGQIHALEKGMEKTATHEQVSSLQMQIDLKLESMRKQLDLTLELLRSDIRAIVSDIAPVKRAMYGLIAITLASVVGAWLSGLLKGSVP